MTPYIWEDDSDMDESTPYLFIAFSDEDAGRVYKGQKSEGITFVGNPEYDISYKRQRSKTYRWNVNTYGNSKQKSAAWRSGLLPSLFKGNDYISGLTLDGFISALAKAKETAMHAQSQLGNDVVWSPTNDGSVFRIMAGLPRERSSHYSSISVPTIYVRDQYSCECMNCNPTVKSYWGGSCKMTEEAKRIYYNSGFAHRLFVEKNDDPYIDSYVEEDMYANLGEALARFSAAMVPADFPEGI